MLESIVCPVTVHFTSSPTWVKNSSMPEGGRERGRSMAWIWVRVGYGI